MKIMVTDQLSVNTIYIEREREKGEGRRLMAARTEEKHALW